MQLHDMGWDTTYYTLWGYVKAVKSTTEVAPSESAVERDERSIIQFRDCRLVRQGTL